MILLVFCVMQLLTTHGSIINDIPDQTDTDVMKYCEIRGCDEGSHIMCVSYRPDKDMGPSCADGRRVDFSENIKKYVLDLVNGFRMKAAAGEETGKDGEPLPKAYLMNELKWDDELTKFAQVLADTCILRNDMCRANERFQNPAQYGGFMRFTYPDWQFLGKTRPPSDKSLTIEKIFHVIHAVINGMYQFKKHATKALIESHGERNIYMTMVHGWSTHLGCGMSTYVDYHPADNALFHTVLFFCNFSHQPSAESYDGKVYETEDISTTSTTTTTPATTTDATTTDTTTTTDATTTDTTTTTTTTDATTTDTTTTDTTTTDTTTSTTDATTSDTTTTAATTTDATTTVPTTTTPYPTYPTLPNETTSTSSETTPVTNGHKILCKAVVALMPIFQVENAPREKLDELEGIISPARAVSRRLASDCMNSPDDYFHTSLRPFQRKNLNRKTTTSKPYLNQYSPQYFEGTSTVFPPHTPHSLSPETEFEDYYVSLLESLSSNTTQFDKKPQSQHLSHDKYTVRRREFGQTSTTPWTRNCFKPAHEHGSAHDTMNKGHPSFVKKESIFLRAPRFQVQNEYSNRLQNLPVKKVYPIAPRTKNPLHMQKTAMNKYQTRRSNVGITRRNLNHLANLVSDYSSHKHCLLDKLSNVLNKVN